MQASFTPELLAENLGVDLPTMKRAMTRMNYYYGKDDSLPLDVVREIVATYAKPHPRRPEEVVESAQQFAQQFNIHINFSNNSPNSIEDKEQQPPAPKLKPVPASLPTAPEPPARQAEAKPDPKPVPEPPSDTEQQAAMDTRSPLVTILVYMAFIFILMFQMEHVASIGMDVSALANETARQVSGWLFAFTFNLTALLMTLRRGISAVIHIGEKKMSYILLFAILDVIFFVMSAAPMGGLGEGILMWGKAILVGSATAFVIYSFNELLTERQ